MKHLIFLLAAVLATACGGDSTSPNDASPVGVFTLVSVNGHALPASFAASPLPGGSPWYTSGSLTIGADGSYSLALADSTTCCGSGVISETGTWARAADSIAFTSKTANRPSGNASLVGGVVTRKIQLDVFAWKRK